MGIKTSRHHVSEYQDDKLEWNYPSWVHQLYLMTENTTHPYLVKYFR